MRKAYLDLRSLKFTWSHMRKDTMDLTMLFKHGKKISHHINLYILKIFDGGNFYLKCNYEKTWIM